MLFHNTFPAFQCSLHLSGGKNDYFPDVLEGPKVRLHVEVLQCFPGFFDFWQLPDKT